MADTPLQDRKLNLPRERQGERFVTKYNPEMALRICERIAEGETLSSICVSDDEMVARQTFHRWIVGNPELNRAYSAAREISAHSMEEEALDIARLLKDMTDPASARVRALDVALTQLRWSAGKRNPRVYSEKSAMSFTVPIQINTGLDLGEQGGSAAPDHPNVYEITAEIVEDEPSKDQEPPDDTPFLKAEKAKKNPPKPPKKKRKRGQWGLG